ncbi:CDP-diacylglycerol--glycerol-3-phosphate 3-phosphatidyltransferase [Clupea harengus]|uniref:CDP-diacylglycerol--glycerol-3-phosphate 3-phosphatidyltransferase n=1 Tax=Clupea harengus TaxID=7950 RepID=A0A6P8G1X6_CLUHA|nr:CDP-diacylglycerol--glycerol-3-phosphate 3-phosphatidyltransferase [Clupea harengus]
MTLKICFYVPNIIGYIRIVLILAAWCAFNSPALFFPAYLTSVILDGIDGWVARRLEQTSRFGAWLDVIVDNMGRSMVWNMLFQWGWLISTLEWCVFVCNHSAFGVHWKSNFKKSPYWVKAVMAKGFKTPLGVFTIAGLHVLPVWLYGYQHGVLTNTFYIPEWFQGLGLMLLAAGRLLCMSVEMWCIWIHVHYLTDVEDTKKKN